MMCDCELYGNKIFWFFCLFVSWIVIEMGISGFAKWFPCRHISACIKLPSSIVHSGSKFLVSSKIMYE